MLMCDNDGGDDLEPLESRLAAWNSRIRGIFQLSEQSNDGGERYTP